MNIKSRPSKCFVYNRLDNLLRNRYDEVGVDAASANFKNCSKFKTTKYYGVDIDLSAVRQGVETGGENVFGIWADLSELDKLPSSSVGVVVSTFSLYHLVWSKRQLALVNLCRLVRSDGLLVVELLTDENLDDSIKIIEEQFNFIEIVYFKNYLSQWYERLIQNNISVTGDLYYFANTLPFRFLAWFLGFFEFFTYQKKGSNKHALIIAENKKNKINNNFDLSQFPMIGKNIFNLMTK